MRRATCSVSSSRSNRSAVGGSGRSRACASSAWYPAPIPSQARPPLSTSRVVTVLTSSAGGRSATGVTMVHRRTRSVCPAWNPSVVYASSISVSSGPAVGSACSRWSATHTVSTPAWSAARASRTSSAPSPPGPLGHEKFVTLMLTRIERRQQRAVWSILLAGREDHGQVEDCRGAREPDHVGLHLVAWRRLDDALEHAGMVVDQEEHRAVPGQWFSGHLLAPSDGLDQYPLRAARKLSVNFY